MDTPKEVLIQYVPQLVLRFRFLAQYISGSRAHSQVELTNHSVKHGLEHMVVHISVKAACFSDYMTTHTACVHLSAFRC